jgi:FAD/FMN-containing dehydrogenase
MSKDHVKKHLYHRNKDLISHEEETHRILEQCSKGENVLYTNFRYDEICFSLDKFKKIGLTIKQLFKFQKKVHRVIYPWNAEYNTLRFNVNKMFNVYPLIVVMAGGKHDVIKAYKFARKYNIDIALRGGAHSFEGFSLCEGIVIDQSRLKKMKLKGKIIKCEAGVLLGPLADYLFKYKRVLPIGSCPNNCVTGFALGGGIGFLARKYGVCSDSIVEAKILLANGDVVHANENDYDDLFWALRGAGIGNYGIVLSLSFKTYSINKVWSFSVNYPIDELRQVMKTWFPWVKETPFDLTSNAGANAASCWVNGLYLGKSKEILLKYLEPFLSIGNPKVNIQRISYIESVKQGSHTGRWFPFFKFANSFIKDSLQDEAIDIIDKYIRLANEHSYMVIVNLGGINDEIKPDNTAFVHRNMTGWFHINCQWDHQDEEEKNLKWINRFYAKLSPYLDRQVYQNAPNINLDDYLQRYYGSNLDRLIAIKQKYDPENVFNYAQSIPLKLE